MFMNDNLQQNRFSQMSDTIIGRVDEMSTRIDDLEKSIQDLMLQVIVSGNFSNDESAAHLTLSEVGTRSSSHEYTMGSQ